MAFTFLFTFSGSYHWPEEIRNKKVEIRNKKVVLKCTLNFFVADSENEGKSKSAGDDAENVKRVQLNYGL